MQKINFVNNEAPYINAENLNAMQSNIENETGITIFEGRKGYEDGETSVTYTLPESSQNYSKIKVVVERGADYGTGEVDIYIQGSGVGHIMLHYTDSSSTYYTLAIKVAISGNTITFTPKLINVFNHTIASTNNSFTLIGVYGYK